MKKVISIITTIFLFAQNSVLSFSLENAVVKSVKVSAESVYITSDKAIKYKAFTVSNPPKIVIELMDTQLKTLQEIPVNGNLLKMVRTGQYQTKPVSISRIVLELTQKTVYDIIQKGNQIIVVVGGKVFKDRKMPKDSPADETSESVKVILPESSGNIDEPKDKENIPVITPKKTRPVSSSGRSIMDTLSKEPVSLDYNNADIREVINMMVAKLGINVVYSDDVSGTITITLTKVPFDEAFRTILNIKGLTTQQIGDNILRVTTPQSLMQEQKKSMLQTRVFFLNYAKAQDVKTQIDGVVSAEQRKGFCSVDVANNALVVTDTAIGLEMTARLIKSLDSKPKQVLIEAKLVEVALGSGFDFGVQWATYGKERGSDGKIFFGVGDTTNISGPLGFGGGGPSGLWLPYDDASPPTDKGIAMPYSGDRGGTGVNLPASVIYGSFRLGRVASNYIIDSILSAAAKKGKAKVLSDPKIATLNNKEASINITSQIPYETTEVSPGQPPTYTTRVTYITTGIILKVTPSISHDGSVLLKVNPTVSQPSTTIPATSGGAPGIDARTADTTIIVKDGETVVIGGLIHDTQSEWTHKIPLLGDIPLLGWLFKKKSVGRDRRELLIFVTPRILED